MINGSCTSALRTGSITPDPKSRHAGLSECRVGCVILASGASVRFGKENKLLADCNGRPLLVRALSAVSPVLSPENATCLSGHPAADSRTGSFSKTSLFPVVVCADTGVALLAKEAGFDVRRAPHPVQSDAVRDGLSALLEKHGSLHGCMFVAGDQPLMKPETLLRLLQAFAATPDLPCRVVYGKRAGNPVVFPASFFDALLLLDGDQGGGVLLKEQTVITVSASDEWELWDVDTPESLEQTVRRMRSV